MRVMRTLLAVTLAVLCHSSSAWAQDDENPLAEPRAAPQPQPQSQPAAASEAPAADAQTVAATGPVVLLGLGAGAYFPTSSLGVSFLVGIDAAYQLPWIGRRLGVGAGLAYSQPTLTGRGEDSRAPGGAYDYETTLRELVFDLQLSFRVLSWDSIWSPHVGIGPLLYLLSHQIESLGNTQSETSTEIGFLATVGVDFRLWRGAVVGEVRVPFGLVDQRTTGDANVGAVSVLLGYRFRI